MNKDATMEYPTTHYRVLAWAHGGATIRAGATGRADVLGRLRCGADWYGDSIIGGSRTVPGFGRSNVWIEDSRGAFVWRGLLEKVR
jgi:hypothetical protein